MVSIAHENRRNEAYARFGARLTLQMGGQSVMANHLHRQGLDRRPRKNLAFLTSEPGSLKKSCAIPHENCRNEAYARFGARLTVQMGQTSRDGPQKNLAFLTSESGSPKKWCSIAHENRRN